MLTYVSVNPIITQRRDCCIVCEPRLLTVCNALLALWFVAAPSALNVCCTLVRISAMEYLTRTIDVLRVLRGVIDMLITTMEELLRELFSYSPNIACEIPPNIYY